MSITRKVAYNTVVLVAGRVVTIGLSLVLIKYLTAYLKVQGYGDYTTAINFVLIFAVIADFGLNNIVVRELAKREVDVDHYIGNVLGLRAVVAIGVLGAGCLVALLFPYSNILRLAIVITAVANYCLTLNQVFVGVFQTHLKLDRATAAEITGRLVAFGLTIAAIRLDYGFLVIMGTIFMGNLINLIVSWWLVREWVNPTIRYDRQLWRKLFWEMMPMGTVLVLGMLYIKSDVIILSVTKGSGAVGIYGVGYKFFEILIALPAFFMGAVLPFIVKFYHEDRDRLKEILQKATEVLLITGLPIPLFFGLLAPKLIAIIAGADFVASVGVMQILCIGVAFSFIAQMATYTLIAIHRQGALIVVYGLLLAENIILNLIFIPRYSYTGAAWISLITQALSVVGAWWMLYKYTDFRARFEVIGKVVVAGTGAGVVLWFWRDSVIIGGLAGLAVYGLLLVGTGAITKEMVGKLVGKG